MKLKNIDGWRQEWIEGLKKEVDSLIEWAFREDFGSWGDVTSQAIFHRNDTGTARVVAKSEGIVAGLFAVRGVFERKSPEIQIEEMCEDGDFVTSGETLLIAEGSVEDLLSAERTALNFLGRLSGMATLTGKFVEAVSGTRTKILDTRKTTPGWRFLEKYAVRQGGGVNHRMGLFDRVLIKDNHIKAAGGIRPAVQAVREYLSRRGLTLPIEVEVKNLSELEEALGQTIQQIMLDNMDPDTMRQAVKRVSGRIPLEASGGITLETVRAVAETGVDFISVGALTHSAPVLDVSMLMV
ncbi:MAG: carboxylating nicotinate-nucleotide diphosphorylase [Calditrichaeota bacterium]|nr:carboxylating nicotinate-nucleotide diphosphorylase [Calditrichota bacterium]